MKELLKQLIENILKDKNIGFDSKNIVIEVPKDSKNGDYSTNIAMQLSRLLKRNPKDIASMLVEEIKNENIDHIDIAGPGFINFYMNKNYLYSNINKVLEEKNSYGKSNIGNNKKVNIEFVSANPTGTLHLGHARGASYGDSLSRIMTFAGYDVTREYYINDAGNQINKLAQSIEGRYEGVCGRVDTIPEDGYHGPEIIKLAKILREKYGDNIKNKNIFRQSGLDYLLDRIKEDLANFRVSFDVWTSEKSLYDTGKVNNTLECLKNSGKTYEQDGALWLKTTDYGDEKDRVLVKTDGSNTYLLPDIAYHIYKYSRGYDELIDVFGADHHGYIPRLKAAIKFMNEDPDKLSVQVLQMVRLVKGKEEIKMSKRTGNAVTINDLVEEVGLDATRYFFSARSLESPLDFDMELAKKESNDNPVYYVCYAYARICSILNEYKREIKPISKYNHLNSEYSINLATKIYEFKDVVEISSQRRMPHIITNYVYELATLFHTFYAHEKVLTDNIEETDEKINLICSCSIVIKNALNLIGVVPKEKM